ncbi:MAG: hypothetical protein IPP83_03035 [Flavobacteriales bacterium]|nr:hypothetical protein [Flavobacteriales bacterium]
MKRDRFLLLALLFASSVGWAQTTDSTAYCDPSCIGQPRPKGFELNYERMLDYGITGVRNDITPGDYAAEVRRNARWKLKVRVPVYNTKAWKVNLGVGYSSENYSLERESGQAEQVLDLLEDIRLRSLSAGVYVVKPFIGKHYMVLRTNSSLNDDGGAIVDKGNIMKHEVALAFGVKRDPYTAYGVGVAFSYTLGRARILPLIAYDHSFDPHWGLEILLPSHIRARYAFGQGNLLLFGAKVDGANYNIRLQGQGLDGIYFLERSDVRGFVRYEREIHDWLWFGADLGYNMNIDLSLVTDHGARRGDVILSNTVASAIYFGAGIFVVPPRSMWQ